MAPLPYYDGSCADATVWNVEGEIADLAVALPEGCNAATCGPVPIAQHCNVYMIIYEDEVVERGCDILYRDNVSVCGSP